MSLRNDFATCWAALSFEAATRRKAKSSVTELRRAAAELDEEAEPIFGFQFSAMRDGSAPPKSNPKLSAAEAGTAHHKFLQHFALEKAGDRAAFLAEAQRLEREKILSAEECAVLDLDALVDFWNSPPGRICAAAGVCEAGIAVSTAKFSPAELAEITGAKADGGLEINSSLCKAWRIWLCLNCRGKSGWRISKRTKLARTNCRVRKVDKPQLASTRVAMKKIYSRPPFCWLHFLSARRTVEIREQRT